MSMINSLKSIIHYQLSSIEKTLTALDQHLGGVENSEAISSCIDSLGRTVFQLMDKMEKNALTTYSKYAKGSQSQVNHHRPKIIISTFPMHSKQYLKQPYRRFYKENSTDVVWTKLNRAIVLLDKGHKNVSFILNNNRTSKGMSQRQKLQESFSTWKEKTMIDMRRKSSNSGSGGGNRSYSNHDMTYPSYNRSVRNSTSTKDVFPSREHYEMKVENNTNNGGVRNKSYSASDFLYESRRNLPIEQDDYHRPQSSNSRQSSRQSSRRFSTLQEEYENDDHHHHNNDQDDQDESVESVTSYSPDVFFLAEDEDLPKSTQALRDRIMGNNSSSMSSQSDNIPVSIVDENGNRSPSRLSQLFPRIPREQSNNGSNDDDDDDGNDDNDYYGDGYDVNNGNNNNSSSNSNNNDNNNRRNSNRQELQRPSLLSDSNRRISVKKNGNDSDNHYGNDYYSNDYHIDHNNNNHNNHNINNSNNVILTSNHRNTSDNNDRYDLMQALNARRISNNRDDGLSDAFELSP